MFLCIVLLYGFELALRHHLVAAAVVAVIAGIGHWPARRNQPRCLRFERDGSLRLQWHAGSWEQMWLSATSLRLGEHVLLVLRGSTRVQRLLLGPDNLARHELAALRRRLRAGPTSGASALHSVAAPGSHSTELP